LLVKMYSRTVRRLAVALLFFTFVIPLC
jgi:hypothetical protein